MNDEARCGAYTHKHADERTGPCVLKPDHMGPCSDVEPKAETPLALVD